MILRTADERFPELVFTEGLVDFGSEITPTFLQK